MANFDGIHRVFRVDSAGRRFVGTAFAVGEQTFVTCAHVVRESASAKKFILQGLARYGDISQVDWHFHPQLDFACGILRSGSGGIDNWIPIKLVDVTTDLGELICAGYFDENSGLQQWKDRVSGNSFDSGWIALQNTISDGVSGGPVLHGDEAVAIVRADSERRNQKYVMPFIAVYAWLETLGPVVAGLAQTHTDPVNRLDAYPIGPAVRAIDIPDEVIDAFVQGFSEPVSAQRFVAAAMALRRSANKERFRDQQILVVPGDLPTPGTTPMEVYWSQALLKAGAASRRTLAAFFEASNAPLPELMSDDSAKVYREFKDWLRRAQR